MAVHMKKMPGQLTVVIKLGNMRSVPIPRYMYKINLPTMYRHKLYR